MADLTVKVDKELKFEIDRIREEKNFTMNEAVRYLLSLHNELEAQKQFAKTVSVGNGKRNTGKRNRIAGISADEKLRLFVDAIMKHNASEGKDGKTIHLGNRNFIHKETKLNRSRNVVPYMDSIAELLEAHYKRYGILKTSPEPEYMTAKDANGQNILVGEILRKEGISHIFNRE